MQIKGNILLVLLVMLLFASAAVLQLSENNYLAHLIEKHVETLSSSRKALSEAFKKLSSSSIFPGCYSDSLLCQTNVSGVTVNYALHMYQQEDRESSYLQYTLRVKRGVTSIRLKAIVEQTSDRVVSWNYYAEAV